MHGLDYQTWSVRTAPILWSINTLAPSWRILYPKVLELSLRLVGFFMSLCPYAYLELSLSGFLTASDQGSLTTIGELLNISALDPLLPTFLIATLCLCALSVITYYSLAIAWEVFWASRRSPSPLDPSAEVVLTFVHLHIPRELCWAFTIEPQLPNVFARATSVPCVKFLDI